MIPNAEPVLLHGGPIHTMAGPGAVADAEAVLLVDGRVAATGSRAELKGRASAPCREVDLQGATALPGLVDTHPHLLHFAMRRGSFVDLTDARNHADIAERIAAHAARVPAGEWIYCTPVGEPWYFIRRSWRDLAERRLPDRHVLDRAAPDHPVMIQAWTPVTPNVVAFNSHALRALSITDFIPDRVCGVELEKDDDGRLTGLMRGPVNNMYCFDPWWTQIQSKLPPPRLDLPATTRAAMADYNRMGVTAIYEAHNMVEPHIQAYAALHAAGDMSLRVMAAMEVEPYAFAPFQPKTMAEFEAALERARALNRDGDDWFRVSGATLSDGGPCGPGFLRIYDPYLGPDGETIARAPRFISAEKSARFVAYCRTHGLRANFVAGAYLDIDDFLAAVEADEGRQAIAGRHWLMQHCILISPDQGERLHALGFDVTTSLSFSWGKGELYGERIGRHAWRDQVPVARLLRTGLNVGCGSDWGPKNMFEHIALATTQEFGRHPAGGPGHRNDGPDHAVSREAALALWTRRAGEVLRWPGLGTLAPGAHADVAVVDRDPLTCPVEDLPATQVLLTLSAGRPVHDPDGRMA
ncbi:amidohydrolase [Marinibaculum pumilum]|uniref:Amidohydrolase n=1 Tax=Marinibaculum pumilum TaxID=1766165 RepID=A0ABV7KWE4_9PROT